MNDERPRRDDVAPATDERQPGEPAALDPEVLRGAEPAPEVRPPGWPTDEPPFDDTATTDQRPTRGTR